MELTYRTDVLFQAYETSQLVNLQAFLIKQSDWNPHNGVNKNQFIQRVIQKADIRIFENIKIRQSWKRPKKKLAWCQNIFQKLHLNRKLKYGFNVLRDGFIQISHPLPVFDNPYGYPMRVPHLPQLAPQTIFSLRLRIYVNEPCSSSVCSGMVFHLSFMQNFSNDFVTITSIQWYIDKYSVFSDTFSYLDAKVGSLFYGYQYSWFNALKYSKKVRPHLSNKLELLYLNGVGAGESFQISQTIPRRTWTEIRWTLQNGKSNVTLEWENFTTYQTFMKPDMRSADLMAEFTIGGSTNILGFGGIISYFELNRISNKNLQNPIQIPKCVTEFERKYTKLTKQVRSSLVCWYDFYWQITLSSARHFRKPCFLDQRLSSSNKSSFLAQQKISQ